MILRKDYKYTADTGPVSLPLYRRAVILPTKITSLIALAVLCAGGIFVAVDEGNMRLLILLLLLLAVCVPYALLNKADEKAYLASHSPDDGEKCRAANRTVTFNDDHVLVHAVYRSPIRLLSAKEQRDKGYDEDMMKYVEETDPLLDDREYRLKKFRCFENEDAFLLLRSSRNETLPLLKSWFTAEEAAIVSRYFRSRMGRRFTDLTGKC